MMELHAKALPWTGVWDLEQTVQGEINFEGGDSYCEFELDDVASECNLENGGDC